MSAYSTFRAGGRVEAMAESADTDKLAVLVRWLHTEGIPWRAIGGGSNILVASHWHAGVFIRLRGGRERTRFAVARVGETDGTCRVWTAGGCGLGAFIAWCGKQGLGGLEKMAGIPGTVGGAICMNAGAFGQCTR